jgi:hypothetical protein
MCCVKRSTVVGGRLQVRGQENSIVQKETGKLLLAQVITIGRIVRLKNSTAQALFTRPTP